MSNFTPRAQQVLARKKENLANLINFVDDNPAADLLTADPLIDQAVAYGDGRKLISALVVPNLDELQKRADRLGCEIGGQDGFVTEPQLLEVFETLIVERMEAVSGPERVKKFLVLERAFQLDEDELTATLKVRRRHIIGKYEQQLAALYED